MNQTLEEYTSRFWKNIFRPKYIDLVQGVQIYLVYRYPVTSAKHSFANTAVDNPRGKEGNARFVNEGYLPFVSVASFQLLKLET